jgi:RNA polymerase sigma-70 factor (ECF subfamily)
VNRPAHDDHTLIRRFLEGERWAFDALMTAHAPQAHRVALGMLGDLDQADDVVQEAFIRAHRALPRFEFRSSFRTWLHRIVVNLCISRIRRARRVSLVPLGGLAQRLRARTVQPARELELRDLGERIEAAVIALPPKQRAVFVMRQQEGLSYVEIASILGLSEGGVRANYFQALKKLRRALGEHEELGDE